MFNGTLDNYTGSDYTVEIKEDAMPCYAKPFYIQNIHEPTLKINNSQEEAPTFIMPKKIGTVRFIADFSKLS